MKKCARRVSLGFALCFLLFALTTVAPAQTEIWTKITATPGAVNLGITLAPFQGEAQVRLLGLQTAGGCTLAEIAQFVELPCGKVIKISGVAMAAG